jgi:hypothetical protein
MTATASVVMQPRGPRGLRGLINQPLLDGPFVQWQRADGSYLPAVNYLGPAGPSGTAQFFSTKAQAQGAVIGAGIETIELRGYWVAGDKGGGSYRLVASEPSHAGKLSTNGGTKWWELFSIEPPTARQLGAKGDGSDDTAAINALIVFCRATGHKVARIDAGRYVVVNVDLAGGIDPASAETRAATAPLRLIGDGMGITTLELKVPGHVINILGAFDKPDITVEDLTLDCKWLSSSVGFFAEYVTRLSLRRIEVKRREVWGILIGVNSAVDMTIRNFDCVVEDCYCHDSLSTFEDVLIYNSRNVTVSGNTLIGSTNQKSDVRAATTANITLSGAQTIDGVACVAGNRVLVKSQTNAAENGIYVVAAGAWSRAFDMNSWDKVPNAACFATGGTANNTGWICTAEPGGTIGATAMSFGRSQSIGVGIYQFVDGATVNDNRIAAFMGQAIYGALGCDNLTITGNTIEDNQVGIQGANESDNDGGTFFRGDAFNWTIADNTVRRNVVAMQIGAIRGYHIDRNHFHNNKDNALYLFRGNVVNYAGFLPIEGTIEKNTFLDNNTNHLAQLVHACILFDGGAVGGAIGLDSFIAFNTFQDNQIPHTQDNPIGFVGPSLNPAVFVNLHIVHNALASYNSQPSIGFANASFGVGVVTTPNLNVAP